MEAVRYPLDLDRVQKGLYVTPEEIEEIVGVSRTEASYGLAVMRIIEEIKRNLGDRGVGLVIRQHEYGIKVLTDSEATSYLGARQQRNVQDIGRTHVMQQLVDVAMLTEDEQRAHERRLSRSAAYVQALASSGYKRLAPGAKQVEGGEC